MIDKFIPYFEMDSSLVVAALFAIACFIQLIYLLVVYGRLAFFKPKLTNSPLPAISVIIVARNEADNMYENIPALLMQDYPEFEVIVVNNQSTDESKHLLMAYAKEFDNLRYIQLEKSRNLKPGKKLAITLGVKSANFEHVVLTDADCKPNSDQWLRKMGQSFGDNKEIVLGYGPYTKQPGFLNKLIRFDTAWIAVNYCSYALSRVPYMGVGRNLAYTKTLFEKNKGFKSNYGLLSGDDDLFIQETAKKKNYTICIDDDAFCYSEPHTTLNGFLRQKSRHFATAPRYKVFNKALLGMYPLSLILMYTTFVTLLFDSNYRWLALAIFAFIFIAKWVIQGKCFAKLKETSFIALLPITDLLYALLSPLIYYTAERPKNNRW